MGGGLSSLRVAAADNGGASTATVGPLAKWPKAADCKSAIPGSNPGGASSLRDDFASARAPAADLGPPGLLKHFTTAFGFDTTGLFFSPRLGTPFPARDRAGAGVSPTSSHPFDSHHGDGQATRSSM